MEKTKCVIYDCQICRKRHPLRVVWAVDADIELTEKAEAIFELEVMNIIRSQMRIELNRMHGEGSTFIPERLGFQNTVIKFKPKVLKMRVDKDSPFNGETI